MSDAHDPDRIVLEGIVGLADALDDRRFAEASVRRYRQVSSVVRRWVRPGDHCTFAFASVLLEDDGSKRPCFVAVLPGELVVAWRRFRLRPTVESVVVPRSSIRSVWCDEPFAGRLRGAVWLHVGSDRPLTLALPEHRPDVAHIVRQALDGGAR